MGIDLAICPDGYGEPRYGLGLLAHTRIDFDRCYPLFDAIKALTSAAKETP